MTALGLPLANLPVESGHLRQHIEVPGIWLERGTIAASDAPFAAEPYRPLGASTAVARMFLT